ncbi:tetratricopeptide repeat protein [Thalassotalea sediminis]|uniref:tetratricopeptide repeat protein n=1 Tax=Thalassotalea sediminis TaxID=1759089 RepID=UPI0025728EFD|nr:hypothetical protein [Thalassotalea sediminis]
MKTIFNILLLLVFFTKTVAAQSSFDDTLLDIQHQWAKVNYQLSDDEQEQGFKALIASAKAFNVAFPNRAEPLVWLGISQSSFAGAKGGLGALSLAKAAKASFEKALAIDDKALQGSAYTSLGTLYYKVPGWPISFGDDDKAKELLEKAVKINPNGIDANYFIGEFWYEERKYEKAKSFLMKALAAPKRQFRPLADESRKVEINHLMAKVDKKLARKKKT